MYIDAHCHLEKQTYGEALPEVIHRARQAGLSHLIAVGASGVSAGAKEAVLLSEQWDCVYATVGIHPHEAALADETHMATVESLMSHPRVVAVGEVGLDYYYNNSPAAVQKVLFERFLRLAQQYNHPIMLHIRDAHDDCLAILDRVGLPQAGGVIHCFTGHREQAADYLARGLYLSIPGVVTFKSAEPLREAVRTLPHDRFLLETDCPFLAPVPHRGKRNEPAFLVATAAAVGELLGLTGQEAGALARENTLRLFRIPLTDEQQFCNLNNT